MLEKTLEGPLSCKEIKPINEATTSYYCSKNQEILSDTSYKAPSSRIDVGRFYLCCFLCVFGVVQGLGGSTFYFFPIKARSRAVSQCSVGSFFDTQSGWPSPVSQWAPGLVGMDTVSSSWHAWQKAEEALWPTAGHLWDPRLLCPMEGLSSVSPWGLGTALWTLPAWSRTQSVTVAPFPSWCHLHAQVPGIQACTLLDSSEMEGGGRSLVPFRPRGEKQTVKRQWVGQGVSEWSGRGRRPAGVEGEPGGIRAGGAGWDLWLPWAGREALMQKLCFSFSICRARNPGRWGISRGDSDQHPWEVSHSAPGGPSGARGRKGYLELSRPCCYFATRTSRETNPGCWDSGTLQSATEHPPPQLLSSDQLPEAAGLRPLSSLDNSA